MSCVEFRRRLKGILFLFGHEGEIAVEDDAVEDVLAAAADDFPKLV